MLRQPDPYSSMGDSRPVFSTAAETYDRLRISTEPKTYHELIQLRGGMQLDMARTVV